MAKTNRQYCGVPQCRTYRKPGISMHTIPKNVLNKKELLMRWKIVLKMEKPFPKNFVICSLHFKKNKILIPIFRNKRTKAKLLNSAFPTENLPRSSVIRNRCIDKIKARYERLKKRNSWQPQHPIEDNIFEDLNFDPLDELPYKHTQKSVGVQTNIIKFAKRNQKTDNIEYNDIPMRIDSDRKLNTMTGIPSRILMQQIVDCCSMIRPVEQRNISMCLKARIFLTMYRIKTNASNAQTAILFNIPAKTASFYFKDCVQLLAKALKPIYWQTNEENLLCVGKLRNKISGSIPCLHL